MIDTEIIKILADKYNITALAVERVTGGWSADAYKITADKCDYFLKVYDKRKYTTVEWINRVDDYMPVFFWLCKNKLLRECTAFPVLTADGAYKCDSVEYLFILYDYIRGTTPGSEHLATYEQDALAKTVALLHSHMREIPVSTTNITENFEVSFLDRLTALPYSINAAFDKAFSMYADVIENKVKVVVELANLLRTYPPEFVLCHTDLHGWNLIRFNRLMLVDWEGLKFAPAEADLFVISPGFFFDYARERFLNVYRQIRPGYTENIAALEFYRLRRRLEDILAFAEGVLYNSLTENEQAVSLGYLKHECSMLV
jgi:Putative homoserine kinase type II (protein kinase fold)